MKAHIQKYKLAFFFLFLLISGISKGQKFVQTVYEEQYHFACRKTASIDLFKVANLYVSPEYGYWGDVRGVPYDGKPDAKDTIKERKYTDGNVFTPPASVADTGIYTFYFFFTSSKDYCGIPKGTIYELNLYIGTYGCLETVSGELDNTHVFCHDSSIDMSPSGKHIFTKPVTIENLLLTYSQEPVKWKKDRSMNSDWVDIDVYTDSKHENRIGDGDMEVDLLTSYDTTFYVIIHMGSQGEYSDSINIRVHPESEILLYPPIDESRLYGINDQITIRVDTSEYKFDYFNFFLNNKDLNKYYLGGDLSKNEITLSALAFSGVEDFLEIIATDKMGCIVQYNQDVKIQVPFPSVFTPDGDGINDVFLGGDKFRNREFHLEVNNRWGNLLYSGESGWDGTYRGHKAPPGTYLYILILKTEDGSPHVVTGTVTLIRENR
ncbi:MAG: gliding motility-associated C-terminal domain-containing protein [Prevotellaceae bacterium]|nr:gliding motility-associated C-terminal domain-containing protein [Prevotellaceae bacterium]